MANFSRAITALILVSCGALVLGVNKLSPTAEGLTRGAGFNTFEGQVDSQPFSICPARLALLEEEF
jgi:hypothetical protein